MMRILITAGGTREYIDPVRFISNASSGRMGYALARAALKAGHKVTLVTAPTALKPPTGADVVRVESAAQMFQAVKDHFARCDCLIMAAAVSDYTPARPAKTKLKKQPGKLTLELKPTPDILKWAGKQGRVCCAHHKSKIIVGFALEDRDLRANAERKMREKHLDMIIANTPGAIGAERTTVYIKSQDLEWVQVSEASKSIIAKRIISLIEKGEAHEPGQCGRQAIRRN
jgi:phosphopantothenoylcysteine decarboxylase/phosphopantothenate--cysteine ligase